MSTIQIDLSVQQLLDAVEQLNTTEFETFLTQVLTLQNQRKQVKSDQPNAFLQSITALGHSGEKDVSIRAEEILKDEIDPIRGWSPKR
ncbi:hypothetical protein [Candidatus Albibeggiatoa sp. nov. NOAA]|uniref:hypothetical protein n=1 Tax=Candidatus Albibeggiatoa sp. nov. NOAA TaxID=3162724 RepID=UPI0032F8613E|nr:hypothetical protein [Thiotrichaceae bacterium]